MRQAILIASLVTALANCMTVDAPRRFPSTRSVAEIESGLALRAALESVGVYQTAAMNRDARVRVRRVACVEDQGVAVCTYEADRCLDEETDVGGDGWCRRTRTFIGTQSVRYPFDVVIDGWATEQ